MNAQRELAAFFLSPALAITAFWLPVMFIAPPAAWLPAVLAFVAIGWGLTALFGLPFHIVAIRRGWFRLWHYAVAGALGGLLTLALLLPAGFVVGVFMTGVLPDDAVTSEWGAWLAISTWFVGVGALSAILFWRIGRIADRAHTSVHGSAHT